MNRIISVTNTVTGETTSSSDYLIAEYKTSTRSAIHYGPTLRPIKVKVKRKNYRIRNLTDLNEARQNGKR